ncbi:hypothetical protein B723_10780 [Pseudomonas fluorescens NCIMB 11764]|uniref:Uncharacterized protein n=1 Tax=Pseudomonas fluorescens NCIMB 11764 TaxID=1221522 RepID=A0A0K1QM75_PSEFL|nr:hypothetical protein B723_10780 [Pseudomonas fluorescens NCIMB 11764]
MPSTLTARVKDGKQSKKIERNTRMERFIEILLRRKSAIVWMFAWGLRDAQLRTLDCVDSNCAIYPAAIRQL